MEFRAIRQTSHIDGVNRNPGPNEHDKAMFYDDVLKKVKYVAIAGVLPNAKTVDGYVAKGDDAAAGEYIWKLDSSKNPAWRKEDYISSITRSDNSAILVRNDRGNIAIPLGALAWENSIDTGVTSIFTRTGNVVAQSGDYTAAQVTNAFDKINDDLDDILEGATNKHFTAIYKTKIDAAYAAIHAHSNKAILDQITDAGGGIIPSAAQIEEWDTFSSIDAENVRDTVASFMRNNTGITFVHDDNLDTLTPTIDLGDFTTDDLPESATNLYYTDARKPIIKITLPAYAAVSLRCSNATEGVDYPTGWTLVAGSSEYDLKITHGLTRNLVDVKVWEVNGDITQRQLPAFSAAYTGLLQNSTNEIVIEGLTQDELPLRIDLIFE